MTDLLEQSSAWLDGQRRQFLSRTVVYSRGDLTAEVPATLGRTNAEAQSESGAIQEWASEDFLILAADLAVFGLPQPGDQITDTGGDGEAFVYEVMSPAGGPPWRYSDPYRRTLRIHTKQVSGT